MADVSGWELIERRAAAFEFEAEQQAGAPLPGEPVPVDPKEELADVLKLIRGLLGPALPYIPEIYTDEVVNALAETTVPVLDKYGIAIGGVGGLLGPELALLALVVPLGIVTVKTHRAWREAQTVEQVTHAAPQPAPVPVQPVRAVVPVRDTGGMLSMQGG
ncbi:hypothetical protein [Paraburkholderia mimosarum]|uniref:hypothetical protein n=1 Tax=Paraburkholderia mimosarum TaxID=312026 RepID=UPI000422D6F6|nr:hypothetical protein [Paraburkholderia mimosarum]